MIGNKIKALLDIKGKSTNDACSKLAILQPAYSRKVKNNTFKAEELIQLADLTGTTLAFNDKNTGKPLIEFDMTDIDNQVKGE